MRGILLLLAVSGLFAQTSVDVKNIHCSNPGAPPGAVLVPIGSVMSLGGIPIVTFQCVQVDAAVFKLDTSTNPPTLRVSVVAGPRPFVEVPSGTMNGANAVFALSSSPVSGYPVMVHRNGLLLTACAASPCNGDYLLSGQSITFLAGASTMPQAGDLLQVSYWR